MFWSGKIQEKLFLAQFFLAIPGWSPIRKWPLIRQSPTHTVCSQTKFKGSGIWLERTILRSEITSIWGWYDQWSLPDGNGLIRGGFKRTIVWSEKILSPIGSDQSPFRAEVFSFEFLLFYREMLALPRGNKKQNFDTDISGVWWLWSERMGSSW